jgi:hypothetical protein
MASLAESTEASRARINRRRREYEIKTGRLVVGNRYTWFKTLRYSEDVWDVLKDRDYRRR